MLMQKYVLISSHINHTSKSVITGYSNYFYWPIHCLDIEDIFLFYYIAYIIILNFQLCRVILNYTMVKYLSNSFFNAIWFIRLNYIVYKISTQCIIYLIYRHRNKNNQWSYWGIRLRFLQILYRYLQEGWCLEKIYLHCF